MHSNSRQWYRVTHEWTDSEGRDCKEVVKYFHYWASSAVDEYLNTQVADDDFKGRVIVEQLKETE
jgi:hypothetical protein